MRGSQEGQPLTTDEQPAAMPVAFANSVAEQRLRDQLGGSQAKALRVRLTTADRPDVEGHAFDLSSVWLNLQLEGDDTEGHAIRVQFPTAADADRFRRNVLLAGALAGSIVLGSAGAIALNMQPAPNAPIDQTEVQLPATERLSVSTGINPDTGRPWRSGFQERSDSDLTAPMKVVLPALDRPADRGPLETVE